MGLLDDQRQPGGGLLADFTEYLRRSGRNLSELPGGVVDWLAGGARAGAEPTMALLRGDALDEPLLPTATSGGRIGAVASALGSTLMPAGAPAGALGAGPVMRRATPEQFSAANRAVGDVATGTVERIPVERLMYGQNNVLPEHVAGYTSAPERITQRPLYGMAHGDDVILLDGHHRAAAAAEMGLADLPVEVLRGRSLDLSPEARAARAAELGYNVDAYHSTLHGDVGTAFRPETHFGTEQAARDRYADLMRWPMDRETGVHPAVGQEAGATYPVKLRVNKALDVPDLANWGAAEMASELYSRGMLDDAQLAAAQAGAFDPVGYLRSQGYDALRYTNRFEGKGSTSFMMLDPSGVRSRFAAFDPARAGEADLLASRVPLSGLLAPFTDDKRKR
jgi:hypothetical protein